MSTTDHHAEDPDDKIKPGSRDFYRYTSMSFKMGAAITAGFLGGYFLDDYFGFKVPILMIVLGLAGLALSIYIIFAETRKK